MRTLSNAAKPSPPGTSCVRIVRALVCASAALTLGCSTQSLQPQGTPAALVPVTIPFRAVVAERDFACGASYADLGATRSTVTPMDFRMFVSGVELIDRRGRAQPLQPGAERVWEHHGVTLLDFENGTGPCANGSAELNGVVQGQAPAGDYRAVRFTLGVPFALNHLDHNRQASPLNVTSMFWAWRSGYKFLRLDYRTSGPAGQLFLHVGSTGCVVQDSTVSRSASSCSQGNRALIELADFRPGRDTVLVDVAALFAGADLDNNQPETARGCMSAPNDRDCAPIFNNLGIAFSGPAAAQQRVFRTARQLKADR